MRLTCEYTSCCTYSEPNWSRFPQVVCLPNHPIVADAGQALHEPTEEDLTGLPVILKFAILGLICAMAFFIRLFAVVRYESVIHEFDPYFNFRTTKYLVSAYFCLL